ncbi:SET domain-protein 5 [Echria macrotheca]|uniref:SET domain-protein 5 n=1 Tax=Echria macrotheca TaxID=438768 RepID=A0AAJ0B6B8_9PEZI|nr:SET domain-protein 5 [Echria macrotheca]
MGLLMMSVLCTLMVLVYLRPTDATTALCNLDSIPLFTETSRVCYPPVDDTSDLLYRHETDNSPWTESPYCTYSRSSGIIEKFCIYSSSIFNQNAGISIIATPEAAASLADAVRNPLPAWRNEDHLARRGQLTSEQEANLPYKTVSMAGKGKGVIATRHIAQFDPIMVSFPAMVVDDEFFTREQRNQPVDSRGLFQRALLQLEDQERFLSLATTGRGHGVHIVEDIIRTNAFGLTVLGREMKGLYPEIARLNHGCDPNAFPQYKSRDMSMTAVATRDIQPGEEITISYLPMGLPTRHRLRSLENWGFNCSCTLCSSAPEVLEVSDRRRDRLAHVYRAIRQPTITYEDLVQLTGELLQLVHSERLEPRFSEYFHLAAGLLFQFRDYHRALELTELSLKYSETFSDPEGAFCAGLRKDITFLKELLRDDDLDK